jgi:hypothetical protein
MIAEKLEFWARELNGEEHTMRSRELGIHKIAADDEPGADPSRWLSRARLERVQTLEIM